MTLSELFAGIVVQSDGTDTCSTLPPLISRYCADGLGTGCPGVPTAAAVCIVLPLSASPPPPPPPPPPLALANSPIVFAGGRPAKVVLTEENPLVSAGAAIVRAVASLLM